MLDRARRYIRGLQLFHYVPTGTNQCPTDWSKSCRRWSRSRCRRATCGPDKPLLGGLLRFDFARGVARVATLAALDLAGLFLAIYTALIVKAALREPDQLGQMWDQAKDYLPLGGLVMLLLFARSGLYRERAQRPGFRA